MQFEPNRKKNNQRVESKKIIKMKKIARKIYSSISEFLYGGKRMAPKETTWG